MDALCIKGWSKVRPCHQPAPDDAERQPDLMINVRVLYTKDLYTKDLYTKDL